jgi:hypothetical protein
MITANVRLHSPDAGSFVPAEQHDTGSAFGMGSNWAL